MMRLVRLVAAVILVGCGRVGFDATTFDANTDTLTGDGATLTFCDQFPTADLCTDFDDGTPMQWVLGGTTNGRYIIDNGALLSTIDPLATNTDVGEAYLDHNFGVMGSRIVLSIDFRIEQIGQGDAVLGQVRFSGVERHGIEYVHGASSSYIEEFRDTTFAPPHIVPTLSVGEWHRIEMDMDLRATPHTIVRHDGVVVLDADLTGSSTGTMRASVGLVFLRGPSATWTLRTDNVVVDIE
jgi:hypothetical protein